MTRRTDRKYIFLRQHCFRRVRRRPGILRIIREPFFSPAVDRRWIERVQGPTVGNPLGQIGISDKWSTNCYEISEARLDEAKASLPGIAAGINNPATERAPDIAAELFGQIG
jgi:hypothetical protein